jgi:hypothetical protein
MSEELDWIVQLTAIPLDADLAFTLIDNANPFRGFERI